MDQSRLIQDPWPLKTRCKPLYICGNVHRGFEINESRHTYKSLSKLF